GDRFLRNLGGAAMRGLGAALHLTDRLGRGNHKAGKCLARLRHASFGKCPHLGWNIKWLEWILGHRTLLLSASREPGRLEPDWPDAPDTHGISFGITFAISHGN